MIDIDTVVVDNIDRIVSYEDDFVGWKANSPGNAWGENYFIGCMWLHKTGTRKHVWEDFIKDPQKAMQTARAAGYRGSDQAWISYNLYGKEKRFDPACGLYPVEFASRVPKDAKIIQFNGFSKPWNSTFDIVKQHWK
jgi:hypothetical protein